MKVYIAGFDVFSPDAAEIRLKSIKACEERGIVPLHPLDNEATTSGEIYSGNVALIRECDAVVANLNPFRGSCEPDAGTAFEVGFATALGKEVWGYLDDLTPMLDQMGEVDGRGFTVEDFGHPVNLMIAESAHLVQGDFADCLDRLLQR